MFSIARFVLPVQCAFYLSTAHALVACGGGNSSGDASNADGVSADAAVSDAPSCMMTTPWQQGTWVSSANAPRKSDHHSTWIFEVNNTATLYMAGGIRQGAGEMLEAVYNQVSRAEIQADGTLGPWQEDTPLPVPTGFHNITVVGSRVYIAGGLTSGAMPGSIAQSAHVFIGERGMDGMLRWSEGPAIPRVALHPTLSALRGQLVLVGGTNGQSAQRSVHTAKINADGTLGMWSAQMVLPSARSHHIAFVHNDQLYIAGGFHGMPVGNNITPEADILRAVQDADGAITGWDNVGTMDPVRYASSGFYRDRWFYVVGGLDDSGALDTVARAPLNCDGTVGTFEEVPMPLPVARGHVHQTPTFNGRVYSVAGRENAGTSFERVFVGTFR